MNIVDIVENTIGVKRAVEMLLRAPLLPKNLFLGAKFRHFSRYGLSDDAASYIKKLIKEPSISTALKLHMIMTSYSLELSQDHEVVSNLTELKRLLISFEPKNGKVAYLKTRTLIKCFDFNAAKKTFDKYQHLMHADNKRELIQYFSILNKYFSHSDKIFEDAWKNTLTYPSTILLEHDKPNIVFYFPPSLTKLEIGSSHHASFYLDTVLVFKQLHQAIPSNRFNTINKLQFSWRTISEPNNGNWVVSYHSKGEEHNHIRVKESALTQYFTMDSMGYSGWHSISNLQQDTFNNYFSEIDNNAVDQVFKDLYQEFVVKNKSKYVQPNIKTNHPIFEKEFYFLSLQVVNDIVADLAYIDVYNLLKLTVEIALRNNINLVIKRHPKCKSSKIGTFLNKCKKYDNILISDASIHAIIPKCKAVITVNSGVGMEALMHLTEVICTGKSEYQFAAKIAKDKSSLENHLLSFNATDKAKLKKFVYYYYTEHLYRKDDARKMVSFWETIDWRSAQE